MIEHEGYEVGYGKPPRSKRFKKGHSGNLRGRPLNVTKPYGKIIKDAFDEEVSVNERESMAKYSIREYVGRMLIMQAKTGDSRATLLLEKYGKNQFGTVNQKRLVVELIQFD